MHIDRGSGLHAESRRGEPGSEAIPLPVASQQILSQLTVTIAGAENPKTGDIFVGLQFKLPPLTPGGAHYFQQLGPYLARLGQAVAKGQLVLVDHDQVPNPIEKDARSLLSGFDRRRLASIALDLERAGFELEATGHERARAWAFELAARMAGQVEAILRDSDDVTLHAYRALMSESEIPTMAELDTPCVYCGCSFLDPCELLTESLDVKEQSIFAAAIGADSLASLPATLPCRWLRSPRASDRPVCSNPECKERWLRDEHGQQLVRIAGGSTE
jgi:hypothetical protein